uniref:Uncharacterized protein n=1 Tax=Meloidogyne incognita TaxID=6306 RepID=A0A914LBZ6_MELIC
MISICKRMAKSTCYKIMFVMGVIDMAAVIVVGLLTGYFGYFGFVFCSSPKFIYFVGVHNFFCWATETTMEGILAINRCIELLSTELARKIFSGLKLWLYMKRDISPYFLCRFGMVNNH